MAQVIRCDSCNTEGTYNHKSEDEIGTPKSWATFDSRKGEEIVEIGQFCPTCTNRIARAINLAITEGKP